MPPRPHLHELARHHAVRRRALDPPVRVQQHLHGDAPSASCLLAASPCPRPGRRSGPGHATGRTAFALRCARSVVLSVLMVRSCWIVLGAARRQFAGVTTRSSNAAVTGAFVDEALR
nr:hypothetical protein [Angustibacter aerolatus]